MSGPLASQTLAACASAPTAGVIVSEFPLNKHEIGGRPGARRSASKHLRSYHRRASIKHRCWYPVDIPVAPPNQWHERFLVIDEDSSKMMRGA